MRRASGIPLFLLLLLAGLTPARAQTGGLELTAFAGPNYSWLTGTAAGSADGRVGVSIGLRLHQPVGGNLSLDPEVGFAYKGANSSVSGNGTSDVATARLWYMEFPIPLRFTIAGAGNVRPRLSVGPYVAIRVGCTAELETGTSLTQQSCSELRSLADTMIAFDPYKTWDTGFVAGAGFSLPLGRVKFDFEFRYEHGMLNISRLSTRIHNRALVLAVGVPF